MGDIIIRNDSTGQSYRFTPTREGYQQAQSTIDSIRQRGHATGGEVGRVESYTGGSKPPTSTFW